MSRELVINGTYAHFKNSANTYRVIAKASYIKDSSYLVKLGTAILEANTDFTIDIYSHGDEIVYGYNKVPEEGYTEETLVIYKDLYSGEGLVYARELPIFLSKVDATKYPEHAGKNRFELVNCN